MKRFLLIAAIAMAMPSAVWAAQDPAESFRLTKMASKIPAGRVWFTHQDGVLCVTHETLKGDGLLHDEQVSAYQPLFRSFIAGGSAAVTEETVNLFDKSTGSDDKVVYEIGGLIHGMDMKACTLAYGNVDGGAKGHASMLIQWQIYSRAKREVVATIETSGDYNLPARTSRDRALGLMMAGSFADATRQLANAPEFRKLLDAKPPVDELASNPGQQERIRLDTGHAAPRSVGDATGAVVLIRLADSFGSGVLVSDDGYILTDAHVVEMNKTVTVRWSDGYEAPAQVVRVHKKRDVALLKTDPHGRTPLPIRTTPLQVGDSVWVIGAPLFTDLQGTVTKGVVSANRITDGFAYIQSDVAMNHGNSGGPMLDDKGYVVALSESSIQPGGYGVQVGLNYFTPIKDVLDFLSLDAPAPPAPTPVPVATPPVQKASAPAARSRSASR